MISEYFPKIELQKQMERLSGPELIQKASQLIANNKLDEAVKIFGYLVEKIPDAPLPLLSRCTWYGVYKESYIFEYSKIYLSLSLLFLFFHFLV